MRGLTCALAVLGFAPVASAAAQAGQGELVAQHFAAARYDAALAAAELLPDPVLAAEWSSFIHHAAGDLPGALRSARAGLAFSPQQRGLLVNALNAALSLGQAELARDLALRLERSGGDLEPAEAERTVRLSKQARRLVELDALGVKSARRARWTALLGLGALSIVIAVLARTPGERRPRTG